MKISATVITLNEEKNIGACLESLEFADEIVVVDSGSIDRTREICLAHPRVSFHEESWEGFGRQKNLAAELAANDWIFNIDADERISPELSVSILDADFLMYDAFRMARKNYFGKRWIRYCGWYPDYKLRLYNKQRCRFGDRLVHESVECPGTVGTLTGNLVHYTYLDISDYIQRMNSYTTLAAEQMVSEGIKPGIVALIVRPFFTFFKMFIMKRGVLEGYLGLILSVMYSVYTFVKYSKAMELGEKGTTGSRKRSL
jgi:(heptosyl)LPS beta-1,4-glucosyltransferase